MKFVYKIINGIAKRLMAWVDRRRLGKVDEEIFRYTDCLATVRTINKFHSAIRLCDIGANAGHWSYVMHQLNPRLEDVVLFEPQAKLVADLHELELPGTVKHVYQCALGDSEGVLTLAGGTASASLFEIANNQHRYFPGSTNQDSEQVYVRILDEIYETDGLSFPDIIKLDVQGYELNVLRGARNVLAHARYLVIELSLREFYLGQPPLWELWKFLDQEQYVMVDHGYELRSYSAPHELLQFDAIFMNKRFERT
jgi:FkbM family methyltransferase